THLNNPLELFYTLASYYPPTNAVPTLDSAFQAVEIASDSTPRAGMKRIVLFITAPLSDDQIVSLKNLEDRANQNQVRFYIWSVTSSAKPNTNLTPLIQLAENTHGGFTTISKPQDIPNLELLLAPLRESYVIRYQSQIKTAGEQQVSAEIHTKKFTLQIPSVKFTLDLKPPNPAFISPPTEIIRSKSTDGSNILQPSQLKLHFIIDFPDGRPRPIVLARFIVDGTIVDEIKQPPFDQMTWDLTQYQRTTQHLVQVEVIDELGLSGKSIETPITVKIEGNSQPSSKISFQNLPWIIITLVLSSAAFYLLILIMGGKLSPASQRLSQRLNSKRKKAVDPLAQTVPIQPLPQRTVSPKPNISSSQNPPSQIYARLIPLNEATSSANLSPFNITSSEIVIGKRTGAVQLLINDPTIDPLHARLLRLENGRFRLFDSGSLYGTWVNYTPISQEGTILEDGDLIHFGKVGFRFVII
ncbi:MAG: FHA domain-containing protein, partial [Anaerolineales bacterium]